MLKCINCLTDLEDNSSFCWKCGIRINKYHKPADSSAQMKSNINENLSKSYTTILKNSILYYYISFCLDVIGLGLILVIVEFQDLAFVQSNYWIIVFFAFPISVIEVKLFQSRFPSNIDFSSLLYKLIYVFVPLIHIVVLVTISYFLYPLYEFTAVITVFNKMIGIESFIGMFHLFKRINIKSNASNYDIEDPTAYKERIKRQENALKREQEALFDRQMYVRKL